MHSRSLSDTATDQRLRSNPAENETSDSRLSPPETVCTDNQQEDLAVLLRPSRQTRIAALLTLALFAAAPALKAQAGEPGEDSAANAPAMAMGSGRMVRGIVTAVAGDKVTLKTEGGDTYTVALTPNTRVMKDRQQGKAADIKVGDGIGAGGEMDQPNKTVHALFVSLISAEEAKRIKDSLGKTWISGKITAIDDLKITILRSDKVSQTIAVDDDTSFKRGGRAMAMAMQGGSNIAMGGGAGWRGGQGGGNSANRPQQPEGEPITLADVKVGDLVAGEGALKDGVFVPTTLAVSDPAQQHHRRQSGDASTPPSPAPAPNAAATPQ
jgi:hypothetical protein